MMRMNRVLVCCGLLLGCQTAVLGEFELTSNDRVVFFGDTLVAAQGFSRYVETFVRVKYPDLHTHFFNCGLRRLTTTDALQRLRDDVLPLKPTVVVVSLGLFDPQRKPLDDGRLTEFRQNYVDLLEALQELQVNVVLLTPPRPVAEQLAEIPDVPYHEVIGKYAEAIREIGDNKSLAVIDWYDSSSKLYEHRRTTGERVRRSRQRDELPSMLAHAVVAAQLLQMWGAEPIRVDVELDWTTDQATITAGRVRLRQRDANKLVAELQDIPLPWALPRLLPLVVKDLNWFGSEMCQFNLRVNNVPEHGLNMIWKNRPYALTVEQATEGYNFAHWPVVQFCKPLNELVRYINKKHRYRYKLWREVQPLRPKEPELQEAFESQIKTLQLWEEGTAKIIFRLPRKFDFLLQFEPRSPAIEATPPAPAAKDPGP